MEISPEAVARIGEPESEQLEYKSVLPPAVTVAQLISSFANADGGVIVLGVAEDRGRLLVNGLSDEFRAAEITRKAIDLLSPRPSVVFDYVVHQAKRLFIIEVKKADAETLLAGKAYVRTGGLTTPKSEASKKPISNARIGLVLATILEYRKSCTSSMAKLLDHYGSVLRILDDLSHLLYSQGSGVPTDNSEGKVLMRILFSSCADTFETFMSDLLYEIFLAKPQVLKSNAEVKVRHVLDCSDMQEFINWYAKDKLKKMQRGSVKEFIAENKAIKSLSVMDSARQKEIEQTLQIRHLYTHQNGIVDERFRMWFPASTVNVEYRMTLDEFLARFEYLAQSVQALDEAARKDFGLASFS